MTTFHLHFNNMWAERQIQTFLVLLPQMQEMLLFLLKGIGMGGGGGGHDRFGN